MTQTSIPLRKAREIVIAPRMPSLPKGDYRTPFTTKADVVADCAAEGCGYHVMGDRAQVKLALDEHRKMFHSSEIGVVLLNQPRQ